MNGKVCEICGKPLGKAKRKYCSEACRRYAGGFVSTYEKAPVGIGKQKICSVCGTKFISKTGSQRFCCKTCQRKDTERRRRESVKEAKERKKTKTSLTKYNRMLRKKNMSYAEMQMQETLKMIGFERKEHTNA